MTPVEKLREALDVLARLTPAGIARLLQREGITGLPRSVCGCPLAVYLTGCCGATVEVQGDLLYLPREDVMFVASDSVDRFTQALDRGRYRFLVAKAVA